MNTGGVIGVIDTKAFIPSRSPDFNQPVNIGGAIIDHGIVHPDRALNPDFTGEVLVDMGGPQRKIYEMRKGEIAKLAAAKP